MAGLQDLLEAYRNYRGTQEWKLGKQEEQMLRGDPQAMGLWEKLQGFGPADMGGIAGAIKTYHGTPRAEPFTNFNKKFINTGEGTQFEGVGHYLAERPGVAKYYSQMKGPMYESKYEFDPTKIEGKLNKKDQDLVRRISKKKDPIQHILQKIEDLKIDVDWRMKEDSPYMAQLSLKNIDKLNRILPGFVQSGETKGPLRSIYETSLEWPGARESVDPMSREHFLQWDKTFSEQPEHIKQALLDISKTNPEMFPSTEINELQAHLRGWTDIPRGTLESSLYERGIPGIAYLDKLSRHGVPNPTYNYVVFGDEIPKVLSHNKPSVLDMLWPNRPK